MYIIKFDSSVLLCNWYIDGAIFRASAATCTGVDPEVFPRGLGLVSSLHTFLGGQPIQQAGRYFCENAINPL